MFYSSPQKVYTSIGYFLISHGQLHAVSDSSIGHIMWTDHAPISLVYALSGVFSSRSRFWQMYLSNWILTFKWTITRVVIQALSGKFIKQSSEVYSLSTAHESKENKINNLFDSLPNYLPRVMLPHLPWSWNLGCYANRSLIYYTLRPKQLYNSIVKRVSSRETNVGRPWLGWSGNTSCPLTSPKL